MWLSLQPMPLVPIVDLRMLYCSNYVCVPLHDSLD